MFEAAEWLKNCVLAYQNGTPDKNNGPSPKGARLLTLANTGNCLMRSYSCHSDHVIEISDDSERFCPRVPSC